MIEEEFSAEDIIDYALLHELEPQGCDADDVRFQQLAYLIAQSHSTKRLDPSSFAMPWRKAEKLRIVSAEVGFAAFAEHLKRFGKHL